MPPFLQDLVSRAENQFSNASADFATQIKNPTEAFSVLLILGGDVVAHSLAQNTGWLIGPPSFSFGEYGAKSRSQSDYLDQFQIS